MTLRRIYAGLIAMSLVLVFCEYPYEPKQELPPKRKVEGETNPYGNVYSIGKSRLQICNPSISQDNIKYPGCMLWLNFQGDQGLTVASEDSARYAPFSTFQHDRMLLTDTAGVVRWFLKKEELGLTEKGMQIQDPEWSTHPDYIACLGGVETNPNWDGYAVRVSDRKSLKINLGKLNAISTPHLWVPDDVRSSVVAPNPQFDPQNGMVDRESIKSFFGTVNVKFTFCVKDQRGGFTLKYADYSEDTTKPVVVHELAKPSGKEGWRLESPLISPDGSYITFNAYEQTTFYESYVQALSPESKATLFEAGAADPHWWKAADGSLFIVYAKINGDNYVEADYHDPKVVSAESAGSTVMQQVRFHPFAKGSPNTLVTLPFKGGLSRDGRYLCTGYSLAYLMFLFN